MRREALAEMLCFRNLEKFDVENGQELKLGEYMQCREKLLIKLVKANTVFSY
jgi:hypothetical protein